MPLPVSIEVNPPAALAEVAAFYATVRYGGGLSERDLTLVAKHDGRLVGVVRLCDEDGVTVLRGMQVDPAYQKHGIGRALLDRCVPHLDRGAAYCLPYAHLTAFYARAGFMLARPDELPPFLAQRLTGYLASGLEVAGMRRQPAASPARA